MAEQSGNFKSLFEKRKQQTSPKFASSRQPPTISETDEEKNE